MESELRRLATEFVNEYFAAPALAAQELRDWFLVLRSELNAPEPTCAWTLHASSCEQVQPSYYIPACGGIRRIYCPFCGERIEEKST